MKTHLLQRSWAAQVLGCGLLSLLMLVQTGTLQAQTLININKATTYQTIEGFGGFGPKKVWWDSAPHHDAEYLNQIVDNLGATIFRTQIYWDGEPTNDNNDPNTINPAGFNFGPSTDNGKQFTFIQALSAKGAKLIGTVWTPPLWMKLYDDPSRRPNPLPSWCGTCAQVGGRTNPALYEEFAEYLVAYVRTLKQQTGVDLYGLSIQNEPLFANPFESNVVRPDEYAAMLKVVGARFKREGLTTKFFGPEHMGEYTWVPGNREYVQRLLGDATVKPYLDIYAVHSYTDGVAADYGSAQGWTDLYQAITVAHGKPLWMTETSDFNKTGFDLGFSMAKSLYLALRFGHISGWVYWYYADIAIQDNQLTPLGYSFKNFYRYIRPGAVSVDVSVADADVLPLAFVHPTNKTTTVVLINNSGVSKSIRLNISGGSVPATYQAYRTSATENTADLGSRAGGSVIELPAQSITTLLGNDPPATVAVTGVSVSPTSTSVAVGSTVQLTATVAPANATNKSITWTSANTAVATVDATGRVTAVASGSAVITVATVDGNKTASSTITVPAPTGPVAQTGRIIREFWTGISGHEITSIPLNTPPSGTAVLTSLEGPTNWADNYGDRIRGYVIPSTSGAYTFYLSGDDKTELYLSNSDSPTNKTRIAFVGDWTDPRQWTKYTTQKSAVINLVAGQKYYVEILHKEGGGGDNVAVGWTGPGITGITVIGGANIAPYEAPVPVVNTGRIVREFWTGISGNETSLVPVTQPPSGTAILTSLEGPTDWSESYGARIRGYVIPSTSGAYTFYVAGDDFVDLLLSSNDNPAAKTRIAFVAGWTFPREWAKYTSQKSAVVNLVAGQKYYVEILHKEGGGGDNVAVGWTGPGISAITVIGGVNIAPYQINGARLATEESITAQSAIRVFPNPASHHISLSGLAEPSLVEVVDQQGRVLKRQDQVQNQHPINVAELNSGLYILRISNNSQGTTSHKVVKQ